MHILCGFLSRPLARSVKDGLETVEQEIRPPCRRLAISLTPKRPSMSLFFSAAICCYVLALARLLQADTFRRYETISDYNSVVQKRQTLSLQIEADLDKSSRQGFGVISVTDMQVACVIPPSKAAWSDGLKELLKRNLDIIAPTRRNRSSSAAETNLSSS